MAMGMTLHQFMEEDVQLVKYYRKADAIKRKRKNTESWLQGLYTYYAIAYNVPWLKALSKVKEPTPYMKEPLEIYEPSKEEKIHKEKQKHDSMLAKMQRFASIHNANRKKQEVNNGQ